MVHPPPRNPENTPESLPTAATLRERINAEMLENMRSHYGIKPPSLTLVLHSRTFAILGNKVPRYRGKLRVLFDADVKVGEFIVE